MKKYNILVTGGCGFIGWNFIRCLYENQDKIGFNRIVNLDNLSYAAINPRDMPFYDNRYFFIKRDINKIHSLFEMYKIDLVVNFAAQTHVDNSIESSRVFVETNTLGAFNLMEEARKYWTKKSIDGLFVQVSTDEVFGSVEDNKGQPFTETTPHHPNNPYSASKAAAELMVKSFIHTYNFPAIITNCSNNYGPGQHKEKLIPKTIECYKRGLDVPIYGDGRQSRDWIYVDDHCDGIIAAITKGRVGESYLFGTNKTVYNIDLVTNILKKCYEFHPSFTSIKHVKDRLGHDITYKIDYSKAERELGWTPKTDLDKGLEYTVDWYINKSNE